MLDLRNLSEEEWLAWWDQWLRQAQVANDFDEQIFVLLSDFNDRT